MNKVAAIEKLSRQLVGAGAVRRGTPEFKQWRRNTELAIEHIFGAETRHIRDFQQLKFAPGGYSMTDPGAAFERAFNSGISSAKAVLQSMIDEVTEYWPAGNHAEANPMSAVSRIEQICRRFHVIARQLRQRHDNRNSLDVQDEYDVQDLMHAILRLDFRDIRPEEWTPSYAGKNARMDLLLKDEQIVLELKKTRRGLSVSAIGDQLIVDIARYREHPDCRRFVCFVYDPEGLIANPADLERDLSREEEVIVIHVIVAPQG